MLLLILKEMRLTVNYAVLLPKLQLVLTTVENKIPNVSDLVKKADYNANYQKSKINILLLLIITSSRVIHLMQK